ncbi:MAG: hypothetical protein OEU32_17195 [Acidimicrobiia bacterium]|nr:hypothetical protein [Acidimicrobiia bacterium]
MRKSRRGQRTAWTRAAGVIVAAMVVASSCSGGDDGATAEPTVTPDQTETPTVEVDDPTPTAAPTATPDDVEVEEPTVTPESELEAAVGVWEQFWDVAGAPDDDLESAAVVESLLTPESADVVFGTVRGSADRTVTNFPVVDDDGVGGFVVNDCMFMSPPLSGPTVWFSARLIPDDAGGWLVDDLVVESLDSCVPAVLAREAVAGYEAYWDARLEYWDPPDVENELVTQTMTGVHLELISDLLVQSEQDGWAFRGRPETHPEIVEVRSPTELVVLDCQVQDPLLGAYSLESGERLDDLVAPIADGQRDVRSAVMIEEDGFWKVSDRRGEVNTTCDLAPTEFGLLTV